MALDLAAFRAFFPEFVDAEDALITLHIADAVAVTPTDIFTEDLADIVVKYRTAWSLSCSPWGRHARLIDDESKNTYEACLEPYLAMAPASGPWVPGTVCPVPTTD